jgi:site-specific recombinase XerD
MTRRSKDLLTLVQNYFHDYLRGIRGASDHTIRAYSDALRLFFSFLAGHVGRPIARLKLDDVRADAVLAFLQHVESSRRNVAATRNCRLAAIRSFVDHLLRHDVTRAEQYGRILAIPTKRAVQRSVPYLEPAEARAVISQVTTDIAIGVRDRALLLFLYNTGARVSEALGVRVRDLWLQRPRQVRLHGKGSKDRMCPLWTETAAMLRRLITASAFAPDDLIFRNAQGRPLTRDGAAYMITKHVRRASESYPTLRRRKVTPHVFRHSCAVALLQAGVDITVIRDYLGHASVATTSRYIATNLKMKHAVLAAFWKRAGLDRDPGRPWRPTSKLIAFLESL